jgi:catechol 2,3-dioxygenase-like lactoylglutathione lyase family enzyme
MTPSTPFSLEALDHVLLLVRGMEGSIAFYEGVLGARAESHLPQYAMVELRAGTSDLDLVDIETAEGRWAAPSVEGGRNVDHLAIRLARATKPNSGTTLPRTKSQSSRSASRAARAVLLYHSTCAIRRAISSN